MFVALFWAFVPSHGLTADWGALSSQARSASAEALPGLASRLDRALAGVSREVELAEAAESLGELVDRARAVNGTLAVFRSLSASADTLGSKVDTRRDALEERAGEDEAALAALYQSEAWRRLDYADVLRRYWMGWAQLAVGQRSEAAAERKRAFQSAERAFARARLEISLPRVATLALLGSAMAKRELGQSEAAKRALAQFETQAKRLGQTELLAPALFEAALLALEEGDVARADGILARIPKGVLSLEQQRGVTRLRLEALLKAAEAGDPAAAAQAAGSLRSLLSQSDEDAAFATGLVLAHRKALAGQDLGSLGEWLRAEAAFEDERYAEARDLYAELLRADRRARGLDSDVARYKYASAVYQVGGDRSHALAALDAVMRSGRRDLRAPAARLAFALAAAEHAERKSRESEARLSREAERLLQLDPKAPGADQARLWAARSSDGQKSQALLDSVPRESSVYPTAVAERVRARAQRLQERANRGRRVSSDEARVLLADLDTLFGLVVEGRLEANPARDLELRVLAAKASNWSGETPAKTLQRVEVAESSGLSDAQRLALLRVQLATWARSGQHEKAMARFDDTPPGQLAANFAIWREAADHLAAEKLALDDQLQMRERLYREAPRSAKATARLEYAKLLYRAGRNQQALAHVDALLAQQEDWGEPALLRARLLTRLDRSDEAFPAWQKIALGVEEGSALWAEAQARRGLSAEKSGASEEACLAVRELDRPEWQDASWSKGKLIGRLAPIRQRCRDEDPDSAGSAGGA